MSITEWFLARARRRSGCSEADAHERPYCLRSSELVEAQGALLSLLATILERQGVISGEDLARSLAEYAAITEEDRPQQGRILALWAARLQDTAAALKERPSVH